MKRVELLAPAGDLEKLKMAIIYGADAVYIGGEKFGLRAASKNFTESEMIEGINFAHEHEKRVYVTCNIIPHNEDLDGASEYFKYLESIGVDAIIIPSRNSVSVNADAMKTSAGALHTLPVCKEQSLTTAIKYLKDNGVKENDIIEHIINYTDCVPFYLNLELMGD